MWVSNTMWIGLYLNIDIYLKKSWTDWTIFQILNTVLPTLSLYGIKSIIPSTEMYLPPVISAALRTQLGCFHVHCCLKCSLSVTACLSGSKRGYWCYTTINKLILIEWMLSVKYLKSYRKLATELFVHKRKRHSIVAVYAVEPLILTR